MKLQLCAVALLLRNIAAVRLGDEDDGVIQSGGGSTTAAAAPTTAAVAPTTGAVASTTGAVAPTTGAVAPTTGAVAPTTGAVAPTTGAVAPTTGAVAPTTGALAPTTGAVAPTTGALAPTTGAVAPTTGTVAPTTVAGTTTAAPTTAAAKTNTSGAPCTTGSSSTSNESKQAELVVPSNVSKAGALEEDKKTDDVNDKKGDGANDKGDDKNADDVNGKGDDREDGIMTEEAVKKEDEELKGWLKENLKDVVPENATQSKSADGNNTKFPTKWGYIGTDCMMQRQRMAARKVLESGCSQVFEFGGYLAPLDKLLKQRDYNPKAGDVLKDTTKLDVRLPKKFINVDELFPDGSVEQEDGMKSVNLPFSMEAIFKNKTINLVTEHGVDFKEPTCGVFVGMYTPYYSAEYDKEAMAEWWKMFMDVKLVVVDSTSYSEDFVNEVFMPPENEKSFGLDKSVDVDCSAVLSKKPYEMKASAAKRSVKFIKPGKRLANVPFKIFTDRNSTRKSGQNVGPEDNETAVRMGIAVVVVILVCFLLKFMWARQRAAERAAAEFYGGYESEDSD